MKKRLLMFMVALTFGGISLFAQQAKLVGVWQQYQEIENEDGSTRMLHLPVWKVLQSDGKFITFLIVDKEGRSMITHEGLYEYVSEDTYHEKVLNSIINNNIVGKTNIIRYEWLSDALIQITYRLPQAKADAKELWHKVKMELP